MSILVERAWRRCRQLRSRLAPGGLILMYHRIGEGRDPWGLAVSPAHFAEHLDVIRRVGRPTALSQLTARIARRRRPYKNLVVTFDDGYADNLHAAKPLLERADVPATAFVVSGQVGRDREFWWDELAGIWLEPGRLPGSMELTLPDGPCAGELGDEAIYTEQAAQRHDGWHVSNPDAPTPRHRLFRLLWRRLQEMADAERDEALAILRSWAGGARPARSSHRALTHRELATLAAGGLIEIGGHTVTHANLKALGAEAQREQIGRGKRELERMLDAPLRAFAYPYGLYSDETVRLVRDSGFQSACTVWPSTVWRGSDPFRLPRVTVGNWNGEEFSRRLASWLHAA